MIRATIGILAGTGRKPVALAATGVGETSFTANWEAFEGAVYYLLDVSTQQDFSTFVYENEIIYAPTTSYVVIGLEDDTTYYYRLRASTEPLYLLDEWEYPDASAAYSLRKLRHEYKGAAVEVRNDSGVHLDIGFDESGDLDTTALLAHCGSGSGTVSTWYDQSGNGNDFEQSVVANQPQIVNSGVYLNSINLDLVDDYMVASSNYTPSSYQSIFTVFEKGVNTSGQLPLLANNNLNDNGVLYSNSIDFAYWPVRRQGYLRNINYPISFNLYSFFKTGDGNASDVLEAYVNSNSSGTPQGTSTGNAGVLNYLNRSSTPDDKKIKEIIIYSSDQSSNRSGIETNINQRYNIYFDGSYTPLLDTYSGSAAAYSLRLLNSSYTGPLIEVRNDSGVHADIGFTYDGKLNEEALLLHCGSGNGTVSTWYDQSGNSNDATQTTASAQPQIVSSGSVITENGKPSIDFDGSNDGFNLTTPLTFASGYSFITLNPKTDTTWSIFTGDNAQLAPIAEDGSNNSITYLYTLNNTFINSTSFSGNRTDLYNSTTNQQNLLSLDIGTSTYEIQDIFNRTGFQLNGTTQELIIYASDQSSNRSGIETNINDFYSIYYVATNSEYQDVLDYADSQGYQRPSYAQQALQDALVGDLKDAGIWSKLDTFAVFATDGDSDFALIDWIRLTQYTAVNSPTFTVNDGFQGDGTSAYITTNFKASSQGVNYVQDNAGRYYYVDNYISGSFIEGTIFSSENSTQYANSTSQRINLSNLLNSAVDFGVAGFKSINRTSSSNVELFVDTTQYSRTSTSNGISNFNQDILRSGGFYSNIRFKFYGMGASLVSENTALYNAWNDYYTAL